MFNLQFITSSAECSPLPCEVLGAAIAGPGGPFQGPPPPQARPLGPTLSIQGLPGPFRGEWLMEVSWGLGLILERRPCPRGAVGGFEHPVPCPLGVLTAARPPCDLGYMTPSV